MSKVARDVFVSYRRDDAGGYAGRLGDALADRFGADHVFLDVVSIAPGADFVAAIREAISACDAFVPVIGPGWADSRDGRGNRSSTTRMTWCVSRSRRHWNWTSRSSLCWWATRRCRRPTGSHRDCSASRSGTPCRSATLAGPPTCPVSSRRSWAGPGRRTWCGFRHEICSTPTVRMRASPSRLSAADPSWCICRAGHRTSSRTTGTRRTTAGSRIFRRCAV